MQEIPIPPPCAWCGLPIGLWEAIVTEPNPGAEPTSWLELALRAALIEPVWHHSCVPLHATTE
jgi:hypothetical protein